MRGQRLPDGCEPSTEWYQRLGVKALPAGSYGKDSSGVWCCMTPNGRYGSLAGHAVEEHEDGTITVSPSILVDPVPGRTYEAEERAKLVALTDEESVRGWEQGKPGFHGYLERGVWRSC